MAYSLVVSCHCDFICLIKVGILYRLAVMISHHFFTRRFGAGVGILCVLDQYLVCIYGSGAYHFIKELDEKAG
jgi:hypothetical protein